MKNIRLFLLYLLIWTVTCTAGPADATSQITRMWNGSLTIDARGSLLNEITKELYENYSIEISGLESRERDKITFSYEADTLEALLRGLLRYLGVKNFAIEFIDTALKRIVVVPDAIHDTNASDTPKAYQRNSSELSSAVQIQDVLESSQAESLDLMTGDLIVEYDGVPITNARQLVEEVENKAENRQVEMIVIREKNPIRLILAGGIIGVRVVTKKITREEINFQ